MSADPLATLAAVVGIATAAGAVSRDELRDQCWRVIHGGQSTKERLGCLAAYATLDALDSATARHLDALEIARAAFTAPKDAEG